MSVQPKQYTIEVNKLLADGYDPMLYLGSDSTGPIWMLWGDSPSPVSGDFPSSRDLRLGRELLLNAQR